MQKECSFYENYYDELYVNVSKFYKINIKNDREIAPLLEWSSTDVNDWKRESCINMIHKYGHYVLKVLHTFLLTSKKDFQ